MVKLSVISTEGNIVNYEILESSSLKSGTKMTVITIIIIFNVLLGVWTIVIHESE